MTNTAPTQELPPASNIPPDAETQPAWRPGTRKPSPATPEMMQEYGGLLSLNVPGHGIQDPTRQKTHKTRVRGRVAASKKGAIQRALLRQLTGNRTIAGTLPPTMALEVRRVLYRIEAEETLITTRCRDLSLTIPELFSSLAVLAPNLRRLLAEQNELWVSVPPRPRSGRKNACLPLDDEDYLAWASKGAEVQTFVASMLKNLTMTMAISLEICAAYLKRNDGAPPTPEQLAALLQSHAVQEMRETQALGQETAHVTAIAAQGRAEPLDPPADWMPEPVHSSPVLDDLNRQQAKRFDAQLAKATAAAQRHDAKEQAATMAQQAPPAPQHSADQLDHLLQAPTPLPADIIPTLTVDQLVSRAMFVSSIDRATVPPATYDLLASEYQALTRRHQQIT